MVGWCPPLVEQANTEPTEPRAHSPREPTHSENAAADGLVLHICTGCRKRLSCGRMKALVYQPSTLRWVACKLLGTIRRSVYWSGLSGLRYGDVAAPGLPNGQWVRLRTLLGGICGTDLSLILQKNHPASYLPGFTSFPIVLGHENVAIVDELGSDVTGWRLGERVCVEPSLSCEPRGITPPCRPCAQGRFSLCENITSGHMPKGTMIGLNAFTGGSWAPYFVAHHSQLYRVPDGLPDEQAVLTDPLACSLHGVLRCVPSDDDRVLVVGAGIIGLGVVACLRALDCKTHLTAIARHQFQEEWLRRVGADDVVRFSRRDGRRMRYDVMAAKLGGQRINGRFGNYGFVGGFDVVYDCIGTGESISDSFKYTRARCTTVLMGTSNITLVDTTPMWNKELNVLGGYGRQIERFGRRKLHTYKLLFELVNDGKLNLAGLLTHTFSVDKYKEAFRALTSRSRQPVIKAAFEFSRQ